ncbi:hypothetical protein D3C85_875110 [compost metagenome]
MTRDWFRPKPSSSHARANPTPGLGSQNRDSSKRPIGTPQVTPFVSSRRRGHNTARAAATGSSAPATIRMAVCGVNCQMAGNCLAEIPLASHTMPWTDSRKAQASGCSAWPRLAPTRWLTVMMTAVAQAPITPMGSHRNVARVASKRIQASSRSSCMRSGDRPRQIRAAPAMAIKRPLRNRRITSGPSAYTTAAISSTKKLALANDVELDRPKMMRICPANAMAVPHCRQKGPASLRSTATPAAHSTRPATSAPPSEVMKPENATNTSSSKVASQALRPSRHCTYQGGSARGTAAGASCATGAPESAGSTALPADALAGSASAAGRAGEESAPSRRSQRAARTASAMSSAASGRAAQTPGSRRHSHSPTTRSDTQMTPAASMARMTRSRRPR